MFAHATAYEPIKAEQSMWGFTVLDMASIVLILWVYMHPDIEICDFIVFSASPITSNGSPTPSSIIRRSNKYVEEIDELVNAPEEPRVCIDLI